MNLWEKLREMTSTVCHIAQDRWQGNVAEAAGLMTDLVRKFGCYVSFVVIAIIVDDVAMIFDRANYVQRDLGGSGKVLGA